MSCVIDVSSMIDNNILLIFPFTSAMIFNIITQIQILLNNMLMCQVHLVIKAKKNYVPCIISGIKNILSKHARTAYIRYS